VITITEQHLVTIMPRSRASVGKFVAPLNTTIMACAINNALRVAGFVAQCAHESSEFQYLSEIWGPSQVPEQRGYYLRTSLGNTKPEAIALAQSLGYYGVDIGKLLRGYGLIQVTGWDNQKKVADFYGLTMEEFFTWVVTRDGACKASGYWWKSNGMNELCDTLPYEQFVVKFDEISDRVNFGHHTARVGDTRGWKERLGYFERAMDVFKWADVEGGVA